MKDRIKQFLFTKGYGLYKVPPYARDNPKFLYYQRLFDSIRGVDGMIVECGVGIGRTLTTLAGLARDEGRRRWVWGFDSFEGFPEPSVWDVSPRNPKKGEWNYATMGSIRRKLLRHRLNAILVKGFFDASLAEYNGGPIALLHLDGDLYQSYKDCLEQLWPQVATGGVVLFDEYIDSERTFPGAVIAINEFFHDKPNVIRHDRLFNKYYVYK